MKKMFTNLLVLLAFLMSADLLTAQINADSPIPVDFVINSPASIAGKYDYGTQTEEWGPTLDQTVTGEVEWAFDATDSLACFPVVNDLTGKMALIRRGVCNFSLKVYHAQEAGAVGAIICNHYDDATQDGTSVVGMLGGDSLDLVFIPAVFASRNTCEAIQSVIDFGGTAVASFEVRAFGEQVSAYHYHTPQRGIRPLENIGVRFINLDTTELPAVDLTVAITDPDGQTTTISETYNNLPGQSLVDYVFTGSYTPDALGEYTAVFTNSINSEELESKFVITENTFAQDNNDVQVGDGGWIAQSNTGFIEDLFRYDFGNFYYTNDTEQVATHVTFSLANPDSLFTGEPESDLFQIRIYDADPDGNGAFPGGATDYAALNETGGGEIVAGFADFVLTGQEQPYDLITVELDEPIVLGPNKIYLVMVQYDGISAGSGIPPWYVFAGTHATPLGGSAVFTTQLFTGGWTGNFKGLIRLELEPITSTTEALDKSKIALSPNPTSDVVRLELSLEQIADEITVRILDFNGKLVRNQKFNNVQSGTFNFDVSDMASGAYFMSVTTPEGFRSKKFQVVR